MKYRYYPYSCDWIELRIRKKFGSQLPAKEKKRIRANTTGVRVLASHLLWMIQHLQTFNGRSKHFAAKRGRWMAWVYAYCEWLNLFTQQDVRNMARRDSHAGTV